MSDAVLKYVLVPVLAALGLGLVSIVSRLLKKADELLGAKLAETVASHADDLSDRTVVTVVESVFAHLGDELTAAVADGRVSDEEKAQLRAVALVKVKEALSRDGRSTLDAAYGERLDLILQHKIAAAIAAKSEVAAS